MKFYKKKEIVEAIQYTGYNFKELSEFMDNEVTWNSKVMEWEDSTPPSDLTVTYKGVAIPKNYYVVKENKSWTICSPVMFKENYAEVPELDS